MEMTARKENFFPYSSLEAGGLANHAGATQGAPGSVSQEAEEVRENCGQETLLSFFVKRHR